MTLLGEAFGYTMQFLQLSTLHTTKMVRRFRLAGSRMMKTYVVRYGQMRLLGEYVGLADQDHPRSQRVVVRSERGLEIGEVLCQATDRTALFLENRIGEISLRVATDEDFATEAKLKDVRNDGFTTCSELIAKRRLQMDLVDVEVVFGRERMVFYYLSEKRVDFRELVKDLARSLHTRIEMRQIGVRTRRSYSQTTATVVSRSAAIRIFPGCPLFQCGWRSFRRQPWIRRKSQDGVVDSNAACVTSSIPIRRERELPPLGSRVVTQRGQGRIMAIEILAQKLVVEFEDRRRTIVGRDEILGVEKANTSRPQE